MPNYIAWQLSLTRGGFRTGVVAIRRSIGISSLRVQLLATNEVAGGSFELNFVRVNKPEDNIKCASVRWSFIMNTETEGRDSITNKIQTCMATLQRYLILCEQLGNLSSAVGGAAIRNIKPSALWWEDYSRRNTFASWPNQDLGAVTQYKYIGISNEGTHPCPSPCPLTRVITPRQAATRTIPLRPMLIEMVGSLGHWNGL